MKKLVLTLLAAVLTMIVAAPASAEGGCPDKGFKCDMVYSGCSKASWF